MSRSPISEYRFTSTFFHASLSLVLLILATSCTGDRENLAATNTSAPSSPPPTFSSATLPFQNTVTLTPSLPPPSQCPEIQGDLQPNLPENFDGVYKAVVNYLNEGGDPLKLQMQGSYDKIYTQVLVVDLDGDSSNEVVVTASFPMDSMALFAVYRCGQMDYQEVMKSQYDNTSDVHIEFARQLFSSRLPFVFMIVQHDRGGIQDYIAVGWNETDWHKFEFGYGFYPSTIVVFDQDDDGIQEILIQTVTSVTPGGGPGRVVIYTYVWKGLAYIHTKSEFPPGTYRIHYLQDGQRALDSGNPLMAISSYEIAAREIDLLSWSTVSESLAGQSDLADDYQRAFAYFRIAAIWLYLQRPEMASQAIEEMQDAFPEGTPGAEFVEPAELLLSRVEEGKEYQKACLEAGFVLDYYYPEVMSVHIGSWGGGPSYSEGVDACTIF